MSGDFVATLEDGSQVWIAAQPDGTVWVAARVDVWAVWGPQVKAAADLYDGDDG